MPDQGRRRRRVAIAFAAIIAAATPVGATAAAPAATVRTVCMQAGPGCDHTVVQAAVDAAAPGDTVLVRPGVYTERLSIGVASLTICSGGLVGSACAPDPMRATIDAGKASPAISVLAPDLTLVGFAIRGANDEPLLRVAAPGAVLRHNVIAGSLAVPTGVSGLTVDARLNDWGTDSWSLVGARLKVGSNRVLASPIIGAGGRQDPPAPSVDSATHCATAGFTPRFVEEAIWCSHALGTIVLHPSANTVDPTPYVPVDDLLDGTPGNIIDRNRSILGTSLGEPIWGPGYSSETLNGLTLCGGAPVASGQDPPAPSLVASCAATASNRSATVVDTTGMDDTVLGVRAADVTVRHLTLRHSGTPTSDVIGIDLNATVRPTIFGNAIRLQGGGCTASDISEGRCRGSGPFVTGISAAAAASQATIEQNMITADLAAADGSIGGTNGILAGLVGNSSVNGNTFRAWGANAAYITHGSDVEVDGNVFETNGDGLLACAENMNVTQNTFSGHLGAVLPCAAGLVANLNDFANANLFGIRVVGATGLEVDARRNHWGRYTRDSIAAHVQAGSGNEIDISCWLLGPGGTEVCPPVPVIEVPVDGSTSPSFQNTVGGSNAESNAQVTVKEAGSGIGTATANNAGEWSAPITFANGSHTLRAVATRNTGGIVTRSAESSPITFTVAVDLIAPDTIIDTGPVGTVASTTATFTFHATEPATFECRIDGGAFSPCAAPKTYTSLAQGGHTFEVRAKDTSGNLDASPATRAWTIDVTAPDTVIDSGPSGRVGYADAVFTFHATEPGSSLQCSLDGGAYAPCTSPKTYTGLAEGSHTFHVRATDAVGNVDPTPAFASWIVDLTGPLTIVISPDTASITAGGSQAYTAEGFDANGMSVGDVTPGTIFTTSEGACSANVCTAYRAGDQIVTGTNTGAVDTAVLRVAPGTVASLVIAPAHSVILTGGSRTYAATGRDAYGNALGDVTASTVFTIAPEGSCAANRCTANAPGAHQVRGAIGPASGSAILQVNPHPPVILTPAQGAVTPRRVTVSGTAPAGTTVRLTDNGVQVEASIPVIGGNWQVTREFTPGSHTLTARAFDPATSALSDPGAPRVFSVDATPPTVSITRPALYFFFQLVAPGQQVVMRGNAADQGLGVDRVELRYEEAFTGDVVTAVVSCSGACGSFAWSHEPALGPGYWSVEAIAFDRGGNASATDSIDLLVLPPGS